MSRSRSPSAFASDAAARCRAPLLAALLLPAVLAPAGPLAAQAAQGPAGPALEGLGPPAAEHPPRQHPPLQHAPLQHAPLQRAPRQHPPLQHAPLQRAPAPAAFPRLAHRRAFAGADPDGDGNYITAAGRAFLLSAVVPGAGQRHLGVDRWVPYAAVEAWGWMTFVDHRRQARHLERRYKDLAWAVARRVSIGPRREGEWDYYEAMGKYHSSGAFDGDPNRQGVQPELDETTFNGAMWNLARSLHLPAGAAGLGEDSPEYQNALAFYAQRAVPPELAWSWGDNGLEQRVYRDLIRRRDETYRAATRALGVILANHVISAVEALVTARLRADPGQLPEWGFGGAVEPGAAAGEWWASFRVSWPRR